MTEAERNNKRGGDPMLRAVQQPVPRKKEDGRKGRGKRKNATNDAATKAEPTVCIETSLLAPSAVDMVPGIGGKMHMIGLCGKTRTACAETASDQGLDPKLAMNCAYDEECPYEGK